MLNRRRFLTTALASLSIAGLAPAVLAQTTPQGPFDLTFDPTAFEVKTISVDTDAGPVEVTYHFYKAMPYVALPVDVALQSLTISVPVSIGGKPRSG